MGCLKLCMCFFNRTILHCNKVIIAGSIMILSCKQLSATHCMMTSWNGNAFCITGPLWGESTGDLCIPFTKFQWHGFEAFFVSLRQQLNKQSNGWWFWTLWRSCGVTVMGSSGTRRWNLQVPDLQMSCNDFIYRSGTRAVVQRIVAKVTWPIVCEYEWQSSPELC